MTDPTQAEIATANQFLETLGIANPTAEVRSAVALGLRGATAEQLHLGADTNSAAFNGFDPHQAADYALGRLTTGMDGVTAEAVQRAISVIKHNAGLTASLSPQQTARMTALEKAATERVAAMNTAYSETPVKDGDVHFADGQTTITTPEQHEAIAKMADEIGKKLLGDPNAHVDLLIRGQASGTGDPLVNNRISRERAEATVAALKKELETRGVKPEQVGLRAEAGGVARHDVAPGDEAGMAAQRHAQAFFTTGTPPTGPALLEPPAHAPDQPAHDGGAGQHHADSAHPFRAPDHAAPTQAHRGRPPRSALPSEPLPQTGADELMRQEQNNGARTGHWVPDAQLVGANGQPGVHVIPGNANVGPVAAENLPPPAGAQSATGTGRQLPPPTSLTAGLTRPSGPTLGGLY